MLNPMKVVLFDIDHTLMHSPSGTNAQASRTMFQQVFGIDTSEDAVEKVGMTEWGLIEQVLDKTGKRDAIMTANGREKIPEEAYKLWAQALDHECRDECGMVLPGILELVKALDEDTTVKLGLLTGNSYWRSEVKLKGLGLDTFFRDRTGKLIGAFGNEARTRSGLLAFAQDRLVFLHDQLVVVDDSLLGAKMLKENNIPAILVATGAASFEELEPYSAYVFEDFGENRWQQVLEIIQSV